jgi:hypothetical protein
MIVADLGRLKAFRVEWTLQNTPRLEPLEEIEFEEAHRRVLDTVTDMAGRHAAPTQRHWGKGIGERRLLMSTILNSKLDAASSADSPNVSSN